MSNAVRNQASIREIQRMTFKGKKNTAHFDEKIQWVKIPAGVKVYARYALFREDDEAVYLVRFPAGRAIIVTIGQRLINSVMAYNQGFGEDAAEINDFDLAYSVAAFARKKGWKHIKFTSDLNFSPFLNTETQNSLIVTPKPFVYGTGFQTKVYSEETTNAWWIGRAWTAFERKTRY